ncbi:carboxylate--amine ligase [Escherichia coli]|nr:carboxylate--amine ligase [Escherichia coli]
MQHIDREKAQRLIERMEALAQEENVNIQKIAECGQIVLRREKDLKQLMSGKTSKTWASGEETIYCSFCNKSQYEVTMNRPGFPGECFICELRLPDHRF